MDEQTEFVIHTFVTALFAAAFITAATGTPSEALKNGEDMANQFMEKINAKFKSKG